ncbi:hypothetical protein K470DRAFT_259203 [Piedraia hortae CBS 480.64]|uniref:Uncharacterized protein n=1 Tax=Piedraia hortae CBS 480.64 TaxID=1314780 RepID=A0A6A7BV00_9PEZI|nr:hypothetical protein K470DRAFT_259203 [Piedraia hortae CBS 480.64]
MNAFDSTSCVGAYHIPLLYTHLSVNPPLAIAIFLWAVRGCHILASRWKIVSQVGRLEKDSEIVLSAKGCMGASAGAARGTLVQGVLLIQLYASRTM